MILPPISLDDDPKILAFPERKRTEDSTRVLQVVHTNIQCNAGRHGPYQINESGTEVICGTCKEKLNPIWVLRQLSITEGRWHQLHNRYQDEMKRLADRSKTKCRHCGEMTPISRA